MKRILIYCHYNRYNNLSEYVIYAIEKMRPLFEKVIFVSSSQLKSDHESVLKKYCDKIIIRENKGFAFGAWKDAINEAGWDALAEYDSLTLMKDTCFGPIFDIQDTVTKMESRRVSFWGLTNHIAREQGMPGSNQPIPEHIQSYYMCFSRDVISASVFRHFWDNVQYADSVNDVIAKYETQLTKILYEAGFKYDSLLDANSPTINAVKKPQMMPDILIKNKAPFVPITLILNFKYPRYLRRLIRKHANYCLDLVDAHLFRTFYPDNSISFNNKTCILPVGKTRSLEKPLKVAIHLHVYYLDVFLEYVKELIDYQKNVDLYITTDSLEKKNEIVSMVNENKLKNALISIDICENRGRDVLPWLLIHRKLNHYDVVGHFHTKKSNLSMPEKGAAWQQEIIDSLISPLPGIIEIFNDKNVGVVIPDMPYHFSKYQIENPWWDNRRHFMSLWKRMHCRKKIDISEIYAPVFPYGTMFWYRPAALKPLFDLNLTADDFPEEPLPMDGTIAHAIERLILYIAWNEDYDFRVAINAENAESKFDHNSYFFYASKIENSVKSNNSINAINALKQSYTWKAGLFVTWLPRKIMDVFKKMRLLL